MYVLYTGNPLKATEWSFYFQQKNIFLNVLDLSTTEIQSRSSKSILLNKMKQAIRTSSSLNDITEFGEQHHYIMEDVSLFVSDWLNMPGPYVKDVDFSLLKTTHLANWTCTVIYYEPLTQKTTFFSGSQSGTLCPNPNSNGFSGFDAYFYPQNSDIPLGEIPLGNTSRSARSIAIQQLIQFIKNK